MGGNILTLAPPTLLTLPDLLLLPDCELIEYPPNVPALALLPLARLFQFMLGPRALASVRTLSRGTKLGLCIVWGTALLLWCGYEPGGP